MFKNLRQGNSVFALSTSGEIKVDCLKVVSVSDKARFETIDNKPQLVIDLTLEVDGKHKIFVIPENSVTTYAGGMMLTCSRDEVLRELDSLRSISQDYVDKYQMHSERIAGIDRIREELMPEKKEERQRDKRLTDLECKIDKIFELLNKSTNENRL